jgi:hypothetical protein
MTYAGVICVVVDKRCTGPILTERTGCGAFEASGTDFVERQCLARVWLRKRSSLSDGDSATRFVLKHRSAALALIAPDAINARACNTVVQCLTMRDLQLQDAVRRMPTYLGAAQIPSPRSNDQSRVSLSIRIQ